MWQNTKLLISFSITVIIFGLALLWFSGSQTNLTQPVFSPIATGSAIFGIEGERAQVAKVVDGDTIEISTGQTVRFIGIDTPETVDPRRPVGCFGKEASNETKSLLSGKEIILQKDISEVDKYKRLLRLVYLPLTNGETLFVNDYLVRQGFAKAKAYPPDVRYEKQFFNAQEQAKKDKKGLWGRCG